MRPGDPQTVPDGSQERIIFLRGMEQEAETLGMHEVLSGSCMCGISAVLYAPASHTMISSDML